YIVNYYFVSPPYIYKSLYKNLYFLTPNLIQKIIYIKLSLFGCLIPLPIYNNHYIKTCTFRRLLFKPLYMEIIDYLYLSLFYSSSKAKHILTWFGFWYSSYDASN